MHYLIWVACHYHFRLRDIVWKRQAGGRQQYPRVWIQVHLNFYEGRHHCVSLPRHTNPWNPSWVYMYVYMYVNLCTDCLLSFLLLNLRKKSKDGLNERHILFHTFMYKKSNLVKLCTQKTSMFESVSEELGVIKIHASKSCKKYLK